MRVIYIYLLLIVSTPSSFGQDLKTILLQDIQPKGKVLELTFAPEYDGMFFAIGAYREPNNLTFNEFFARAGTHHYEMRHLTNWNGTIDYIVTDAPEESFRKFRLVEPTILEEFDLLFSTDEFSPMTVNFLREVRLFSYPFTIILIIFNIFLFIILWLLKRSNILKPLLISCIVTFILMDVKNMTRHLQIIDSTEKTYPYLPATQIPHSFLETATPLLKEGPWTFQGRFTIDFYRLIIKHRLANIPYINNPIKGTYIITEKPSSTQKVLFVENGIYLAQAQ